MGQATVPANSTVAVFNVPPGTVHTVVFQPSGQQAVYLGTSPHVTATNGLVVPATPLLAESYVTSAGSIYYATTGNATASSFMYLISAGS